MKGFDFLSIIIENALNQAMEDQRNAPDHLAKMIRDNPRVQRQMGVQQQQMSSRILDTLSLHVIAQIAGGNPTVITRARGLTGVVRNGAGDSTFTMQEALDFAGGDGCIVGCTNGGVAAQLDIVAASATTLRARCFQGAQVATDTSFTFAVIGIGPN